MSGRTKETSQQQSPAGRSGAEKWQHLFSDAYFPLDIESGAGGRFNGTLDTWPLGLVGATRITCDPVLYRRDPRHLRDERESSLLISVPSRAGVTFRQNGRQARCRPGGFVVERSDAPYEYWHGAPDVQWVVKVPRDGVRARIGSADRFLGLSFDARRGLGSCFLSSLHAALRHAQEMDGAARGMAGDHLLEILCLALREDARAGERPNGGAPGPSRTGRGLHTRQPETT